MSTVNKNKFGPLAVLPFCWVKIEKKEKKREVGPGAVELRLFGKGDYFSLELFFGLRPQPCWPERRGNLVPESAADDEFGQGFDIGFCESLEGQVFGREEGMSINCSILAAEILS